MTSGDSKIKFTVEGITQLHQSFQSILNDSKALTEEWNRQGTSIVKSLQEQIELLKKRNSFGTPANPFVGGGSQQVRTEGLGDIEAVLETISSDGVLIHRDSLKELASLLKSTTPSIPGKPSSEEPSAKPTASGEKEKEGENQTARFLRNFVVANLLRPFQSKDPFQAGLGMASNAGSSLMAMGGKAGWAGAALAAVAGIIGAKYNAIAGVAPTAAEAARLMGGNWESYVVPGRGGQETQYGLQRNDVLQRQMALARAMGKQNLGKSFDEALLWESTTMLGNSDITAFARSARGDKNFSLASNLGGYLELLKKTGVSNEKIQIQMSEYLKELVSLNQMQLEEFGKSDTTLNAGLYAMIAKALPQTAESNPALIGRLASGFYSGMSTASSKQIEALQYTTAARTMGGRGSWYQARMMKEDPFGLAEGIGDEEKERRRQYSQNLLKAYRSATGDTDEFAYLLEKQFGFKSNQAFQFAKQYDAGSFNWEDFVKEAKKAKDTETTTEQLRQELPAKVDAISKLIAQWEATKIGQDVSTISSAVGAIRDLLLGAERVGEQEEAARKEIERQATSGHPIIAGTIAQSFPGHGR